MTVELLRRIGRGLTLVAILFVLGVPVVGLVPSLFVQPPVEMPGGPRTTEGVSTDLEQAFMSMAPVERLHFVVQFPRELTTAEVRDVEDQQGISLDGPIPENAYITSSTAQRWPDVREALLNESPPATKIFEFRPRDKLAPRLRDPNDPDLVSIPDYAQVGPSDAAVFVRFFDDVPLSRQRDILVDLGAEQADGATLTRGPTGIWAVSIPDANLDALATFDEVRFIEPAMPRVIDDIDQARVEVGASALDLDGTGAVVAQWEGCHASTLHPDLANRVMPVGNISFLCRDWKFDDASNNGRYDIGETIAVDIDEDGSMDAVLDPPSTGIPTNVDWKSMTRRISSDGGVYVKKDGGNPDLVEDDDITFSIDAGDMTATPSRVTGASGSETLFDFVAERHSTLVAGIIAGNSQSEVNADGDPIYPGIAPAATIRSHAWRHSTVVFDYFDAVDAGARVSSNSFGWEYDYHIVPGADPYPGMSQFYDEVVSGREHTGLPSGMPERMLIVASSGNAGDHSKFWRTGRIVNSAKNVVAVGNVSSSHAANPGQWLGVPAYNSGRGPTMDGRLTPILSAPGTQMTCITLGAGWACAPDGDTGITSTLYVDTYGAASGTSFSTPIVSGSAALLSRHYEHVCERDPVPQDLRALLVHSAKDLTKAYNLSQVPVGTQLVGPDFVFGYGLLKVDEAADLVRNTVNDEIEGGWVEHRVLINSLEQLEDDGGDYELRVTLVWDDPPYYAEYPPRATTGVLQNDIDLEVIDPDGNRHLPWVLDASPGNEGNPAIRESRGPFQYVLQKWRDHRNTIEQVAVDFDMSMLNRAWTIRVRDHELRRGPQAYTLVSKAFVALPGTDCGGFSNGSTVYVANPIDMPDTPFAWMLFWLAVIILIWLIFEASVWMFETITASYGNIVAYLSVFFLLLFLYLIFRLLVSQSVLFLAYLVLLAMAYVLWRATRP